MLAARHRLRTSAEFAAATRRGVRAGSAVMVVHVVKTDPELALPPRVGFVVSKAVGNAVVRNRTKRRLRALVGARLATLPPSVDIVVRANPVAATTTFEGLGSAFDAQLATCLASRRFSAAGSRSR